ncbi:MAG: 3-dehydroquinate synthase [Polyangiaceae bacterium]|nr:3-dehydroquinate synthase [Polyangiaceae bacterium]
MSDPSPSLLLTGFMGAGKSTAGRLAAERAGLPFVDLDDEIERAAGTSVAEIFQTRGEPAFRDLERAALRRLLDDPTRRVIALGGGALLDPAMRRATLARAVVVTLTASPRALAARTLSCARPLLDSAPDREARVRELLAARAGAYAEAHARIATDAIAPDEVADKVLRVLRDHPLLVPLGARSYGVRIAAAPFASIADAALGLSPTSLFVVTDATVASHWGAPLTAALRAAGLPPAATITLTPGEPHKRLAAVEAACAAMIDAGADRGSLVLAHGGGVASDIAGFAAAVLFRGVRWIAAPTTLLAMVDASVGGKTGVDLGPAKNAIGAFHQPSAVVLGPSQIATETDRAYRSGLAEVVKSACVGDAALLDLLERDAVRNLARDRTVMTEVIRRSVAVKAAIVARDEREAGDRALLNFGHTLGHALEAEGAFLRLTHGEAVSLGMVAMLRAGVALGLTPPDLAARVTALLTRLGLPVRIEDQPIPAALHLLSLDKKRRATSIRAVLLQAPGHAIVEEIPHDRLAALLAEIATPP